GGDTGIDDLELYLGKAFPEHYLEVTGKSVGRVGISPSHRLAQYEDPVGPRCLCCGNHVGARCPVHAGREKGRGKKLVIAIRRAALICTGTHCASWRPNSAN